MHPLGGELLARRPEPCRLSAALCIQYVAPLHTCRHPVVAAPAWRCSGVSQGASMAQASARPVPRRAGTLGSSVLLRPE